jgi:NAD(P)-dependent dehydrogenase (short-subunit alcohol dehydrogenase family)
MTLPRLDGKVAFVAGASRGIGRAIACALADQGALVVVAARTEHEGESKAPGTIHSVAAKIRERGGSALPVRCDVTDEASVASAVKTTVDATGRIDVLVANAGVMWLAPTLETPLKRWELCLRVNLTGVFLVTRAVLPHVLKQRSGSLIALTTTGVHMTELGTNAYWVSKAGVERYYTGLASELAPHNIAVNCIAPAKVVLTEGWALGGGHPLSPDMIEPESAIATAATWLAGQDASGVTGTVKYSLDLLAELGSGPPAA